MNNTAKATDNSNIGCSEKTKKTKKEKKENFLNGNIQGKAMKQDSEEKHSMSLRLPMEWHKQMEQRAKELNAPVSYVYRMAITTFIQKFDQKRNEQETTLAVMSVR